MANCHTMNTGETYTCGNCGVEFVVQKECEYKSHDPAECGCTDMEFSCCGEPMEKKGAEKSGSKKGKEAW